MKNIILLLFITLSLLSITSTANCQINNDYKWLHPSPAGNNLNWVKRWDANNWYIVGNGTTFMKTSNSGSTWTIFNNLYLNAAGGAQYLNDAYFADMNTGLACGSNGRILRTTNGGNNWDAGIFVIDTTTWWQKMYFINSNTGYAAGTGGKLAKTMDGGLTWTEINIGGNSNFDVCAKDTNNIMLAYNSGVVRRTTNAGANWSNIVTGIPGALLRLIIVGGDTVYASSASGGVGMSTNFGATWTNLSGSLPASGYNDIDIVTITGIKYAYLTGNKFHLYRAPIGSNSWDSLQFLGSSQVFSDILTSSDFSGNGDTIVTVGYNGFINVRYSQSNRTLLTKYVRGDETQYDIWAESSLGKVIVAGYPTTTSSYDQIMYSTNGGANWQISNFPNTDDAAITSICMVNSLTGFAGDYNGNSFKTTDGGETWTETSLSGSSNIEEVFFPTVNTGYVFGNGNYKTTNSGISWAEYATGQSFDFIYGSFFINETTGWTVGDGSEVFKTTNGGTTVTQQDADVPPSTKLYDIFMIDGSTGWLTGAGGIVRKTTNGGTNWSNTNTPYTYDITSVYFVDQMNGMATGGSGTVFRTSDGGTSWEANNTSANDEMTQVYMTSSDTAFICGYSGQVFRFQDIETGIEILFTNTLPEKYFLNQNYPNPFNPTTTIKFGLPKQSTVSLRIYDIAGRERACLINEQRLNAGEISYGFDAGGLSSGVYFYSLFVDGGISATRKMIIIK